MTGTAAPAPRVVSREEIRAALSFGRLVPALARGFRDFHTGRAVVAPVSNLHLPEVNGKMHVKPGYLAGGDALCVKIATCYYDNPRRGLPTRDGVIVVADQATGRIEALLCDAGLITDLRTAGASAVAVDALAAPGPVTLGLVGAGTQAWWHAAVLPHVRRVAEVRVWARRPDQARALAARIAGELGLPATATSLDAAADAAVVVTATPARAPVLDGEKLRRGALVVAMGADAAGKRELGPGLMEQVSLLVADSRAQCETLGELQWVDGASPRGVAGARLRVTELGAILAGAAPGRQSPDEIVVFDSTGVAFQDVVGAVEVLRALRPGGRA